jgi:hypothetical protein
LPFAALLFCSTGCDPQHPNPMQQSVMGTLSGTLRFQSETPASLSGFRINLYRTIEDLSMRRTAASATTDEAGMFSISGLLEGAYYVEAWKDNDGNQCVSKGDYFGFHVDADSRMCACCVTPGACNCICVTLDVVR